MANAPQFRNLRIGLVLTLCYLCGMAAAFCTTELIVGVRQGTAPATEEHDMAQLSPSPK